MGGCSSSGHTGRLFELPKRCRFFANCDPEDHFYRLPPLFHIKGLGPIFSPLPPIRIHHFYSFPFSKTTTVFSQINCPSCFLSPSSTIVSNDASSSSNTLEVLQMRPYILLRPLYGMYQLPSPTRCRLHSSGSQSTPI